MPKETPLRTLAALLLSAALALPTVHARPRAERIDDGDWPRYTRDLAGTRFSPLKQITTANVATLATAWSFRVRPEGGGAIVGSATPIVVDGILYLPIGNAVVALDGVSGREIWRHPVATGLVRRAVSWWPGDKDHRPRIFYSNGDNLVALDAATGKVDPRFGNAGQVALGVPYFSPPTVYRNVLIVGANTQEMQVGPPGNSRAFDRAPAPSCGNSTPCRSLARSATKAG
jgi:quinoprotein glucose dehydrogenase